MAWFDFPLEKLQAYRPERREPADFDAFWKQTLAETRAFPLNATFAPADFGLKTVEIFDVTFSGWQGQPIKGWFLLPRNADSPLPCVVEFIGYGGGRSFPYDWLTWSGCGYAHFVMDTRGQGSNKKHGDTPDVEPAPANCQAPGFLTRGILSPETYYYRRVFSDALRAVEAARTHPLVDADKIIVTGRSQGGGISLAAAGLDASIAVAMLDVPFLCNFQRAIEVTDSAPYAEITHFCKTQRQHADQAFQTLAYFDGMNFAVRARAKAFFSVALMDKTCPPSTVFSAYNHYAGDKSIQIWPFNDHEGGEAFQVKTQVKYIQECWSV
jgi:cephalosporin-C deacetylase